MTGYLLDVNVLLALIDPHHQFHRAAVQWLLSSGRDHWLTCPISENGAVRIASNPNYPATREPSEAIEAIRELGKIGEHEHIADDVSLLDADVDPELLGGSSQITDTYLALLAQKHDSVLATFDRRVSTAALAGHVEIFQIPT